jgi:hypothetical protein
VGISGIVATASAANHVVGWLGGLETIRFMLNKVPNPFTQRLAQLRLQDDLRLSGVSAYVLTGHGPLPFSADDSEESFGGDSRIQVIGLTLCALVHECGSDAAYDLFMERLVPRLFDGTNGLTDGLGAQLCDKSLRTRILNEGASRGLTQRLTAAVQALNLPFEDVE